MKLHVLLAAVLSLVVTPAFADVEPVLAVPDTVAIAADFESSRKLDKAVWNQRQGTRWSVEDGVLRGRESSAEYQAKKSHHQGLEPRLNLPTTPTNFVAKFSVRFLDGQTNAIVPFVEFGHHVCRVRFHADGLELLAESESLRVASTNEVTYAPGRWYHCLAEMKDGRFVMQIDNGPTLFAKHASFKLPPPSGGAGFGIAGPRGGQVELDNVTIWTVADETQPTWSAFSKTLSVEEPVIIPKARERFLAKKKKTK